MRNPTEAAFAYITGTVGRMLATLGLARVEGRLVRGVPLRFEFFLTELEFELLRGRVTGEATVGEWVTRATRVVAAGFIETPAPTVEAGWEGDLFRVRVSWTPERLPWAGVLVPGSIPRSGPLGKSPRVG
jgi:hypothetical protein